MDAESIKQELEEEAKKINHKLLDVDKEHSLLRHRAEKWAEYTIVQFTEKGKEYQQWLWKQVLPLLLQQDKQEQQKLLADMVEHSISPMFDRESYLIWTTKPYAHKALFTEQVIREIIYQIIEEAREQEYISYDGKTLTEKGVSLLRFTPPEDYINKIVQYPDYTSIRAIADKDKELFPDPEPIRQEAAGAIINFTSWEAALVVYTDCACAGDTLYIHLNEKYLDNIDSKLAQATVVERTDGAGKKICAAIFPHIPFVTDYLRNISKVVTRVECKVSYYLHGFYTESIILTRGQVHELDWRGVLPQPEPQAAPSHGTIHPSKFDGLIWFVGSHGELYEKRIIAVGENKGEEAANAHYPSAVIRDQQGIQALAEHSFQTWFRLLNSNSIEIKNWELSATEGKRLYVSAFISAYTNEVAKRDKEAGITPTTPATSTTGARATLSDIKRTPQEDLYIIELVDPGHLDEPQLVYVHVGDGAPQQAAAGQAMAGYDIASSSRQLPPMPPPEISDSRQATSRVQHIYLKRKK